MVLRRILVLRELRK